VDEGSSSQDLSAHVGADSDGPLSKILHWRVDDRRLRTAFMVAGRQK
jgi:hypothetical protein